MADTLSVLYLLFLGKEQTGYVCLMYLFISHSNIIIVNMIYCKI